ncbi:MAG: Rossmann-like and DUF2520 domain-containing protein [Balneolales bacterium]
MSTESSIEKYPRGFSIIGTGRLGSALALRLHKKGYVVRSLFNRTLSSCEKLADQAGTPLIGTFPKQLDDLGDLVFLCLPDDILPDFARKLAERLPADNSRAWIHTSGALPAEVLQPLGTADSPLASFHPVQTFTQHNLESAFDHCFVAIQGDEALCKNLKQVVRAMDARPLIVNIQQKIAIHLAAVFVCNYIVPLFAASQQVLRDNEVEVRSGELFGPIVTQTIEGLFHHPAADVLTGPVVRGDVGTIEQHLNILKKSPEWDRIYRELGRVTLRLARNMEGRNDAFDSLLEEKFDNPG